MRDWSVKVDNNLEAFSSNPRYSPDGLDVEIEKEELANAQKIDAQQLAVSELQQEAPKKPEAQEAFDPIATHEKILGVVDSASRVPRDIVGGAMKAVDNTMSFLIGRDNVDAANKWLGEEIPGLGAAADLLEEGTKPDGTISNITQELSQFILPFTAYMKGLKAISVANGVQAGAFTTGFLSDIITSGTALDPHMERLATMARDYGVDNEVIGWLADNENETDSEGRLKNILENAGLGVGVAAVFASAVVPLKGLWRMSKEPRPRSPSIGSPQAQRGHVSLKGTATEKPPKIEKSKIDDFADDVAKERELETLMLHEKENDIFIDMIKVPKDAQKQGKGTDAINDIINKADKEGKRVILEPAMGDKKHGTTSRSRLVKFYKRFGFKESKGKNIDYEIGAGKMYREPVAKDKATEDKMDSIIKELKGL